MKKTIFNIAFILCLLSLVSCKETPKAKVEGNTLTGIYHDKNVFIQNPSNPNGIGYCVNEVYVNGKTVSDEINSSAIEIDLKGVGLKEGDTVKIELKTTEGCTPKFLNPEVLD